MWDGMLPRPVTGSFVTRRAGTDYELAKSPADYFVESIPRQIDEELTDRASTARERDASTAVTGSFVTRAVLAAIVGC